MDKGFYPLLTPHNGLTTGNLRQSKHLAVLPVENRVSVSSSSVNT
jgi:hypothetical protein